MLDNDIAKLIARDAADLDDLESGIWRMEARHNLARIETRRIVSWQAAIMLVAMIGAAGLGVVIGTKTPSHSSNLLMAHNDVAPSSRLFGGAP
jgi:hypothetical protein